MPKIKRNKTKYPGTFYISGKSASGKEEKIYYIRYRKSGKMIEEKAGRQFQDDMTPARAANIRAKRIEGDQLSNLERREERKKKEVEKANKWTINRLWNEYKAGKPNLKGIVTDENRFKNYIEPPFGDKEPKDIAPLDIDRIRVKLLKTRSPGTVKNIMELLRRIINFGAKKNICPGIGFVIEMPKLNNQKTEDLSPDQLKRLLTAIEDDSNIQAANLMKMVLFTGIRRGELFKLKWEDIDFERAFICLKAPKGGQDQKIPMNEPTRKLLDTHPKTDSSFVFPGRGGNQRTDIKKQVNRIKENAGLPKDFRALHGLRHVYASMLASSGQVDMYTLQKLLTHKSPQMTQRYAHLRNETLKRASDLAGDIIKDADNNKKQVVNMLNYKK